MKLRQLERETEDGKQMLREREGKRERVFCLEKGVRACEHGRAGRWG